MTKEQLSEIQVKRLRGTIKHASDKVPFYRKRYSDAGVGPNDIVDVSSITKLPLIEKKELRATPLHERTAMSINVASCISRKTSGSTGTPFEILEDPYSAATRDAMFLQWLWAYGVRPLDRICRLIPPALSSQSETRLADMSGAWGCIRRTRSRRLSLADDIPVHLKFFSKWKPKVLIAPPSYLKALMKFSEERGCSANFELVVTSGEILDGSTRARIGEKLQAEVYDYYGTEETGPLAWECPGHMGYHIGIESSAVEFLRNGEPVASGESGEICATSFHRMATPIIRYSTGDMGRPLEGECSCGRGLPLMSQVEGRVMDFIVTADGRLISPYSIMSVLEALPGVDQYKVVQRRDFSIELLLRTTKRDESILRKAGERCKTLFDDSIQIDSRLVDAIDNRRGLKLKMVESLVT
jgi:phenylacetate-CoA ligase